MAVLILPHCPAEGTFGVETPASGSSDDGEQQLTQLLLGLKGSNKLNRRSGLPTLRSGRLAGQARPSGPVQSFPGTGKGRKILRNSFKRITPFGFFGPLDGVPLPDDVRHADRKGVLKRTIRPEDVRITADHFRGEAPHDVVKTETSALFREAGVKHHLEQDIAQLPAEFRLVGTGFDCFGHLESFLKEVLNQRLVGQRRHPGAMFPEGGDHLKQGSDGEGTVLRRDWRRRR